MGTTPDPRLPGDAAFSTAMTERLNQLGPLVERMPFTFPHAQRALRMVNEELPPNAEKNQQFKDSAIWAAVLDAGSTWDVRFVALDSGFFVDRKPSKGLAANLTRDLQQSNSQVRIYGDLAECLSDLQGAAPALDIAAVSAAVSSVLKPIVSADAATRGMEVDPAGNLSFDYFATESPNLLALNFVASYPIVSARSDRGLERVHGEARASGSCEYETITSDADNLRLDEITYDWVSPDGETDHARSVYISMNSIMGERTRPFSVRVPLTS